LVLKVFFVQDVKLQRPNEGLAGLQDGKHMYLYRKKFFRMLYICRGLALDFFQRLQPYTLVGFDLTTHSYIFIVSSVAGVDDTTRPRCQDMV
jgi:hypothetical protein